MQHSQWEVIILKPTSTFLSFLSQKFPDFELPPLNLLQANTTAYTIKSQPSEEETVEEIERQYVYMFQHEVARCLGYPAAQHCESSFFDFLRCFKFELHSEVIVMEPSMEMGHDLLCIKPRSVLIQWMEASIQDQESISILERIHVPQLVENATVVVKNFNQVSEVKTFIEDHYQPIFNSEMSRICDKNEQWPAVNSIQEFSRYFNVEIHTQLLHLH